MDDHDFDKRVIELTTSEAWEHAQLVVFSIARDERDLMDALTMAASSIPPKGYARMVEALMKAGAMVGSHAARAVATGKPLPPYFHSDGARKLFE